MSKIEQDYTAASSGKGAEDKDAKYSVTPVIFNSPDKAIRLLAYWALVLASMKSIFDTSKLEYLLRSFHSYTPAQRAALVAGNFKDSVAEIEMNGIAFTDDNERAYDELIPGIFSNLSEQVLTATINNEKDFQGFYEAFQAQFMGVVSMTRLFTIATTSVSV